MKKFKIKSHQINFLKVYILPFTVFSEESTSCIVSKDMGAVDIKYFKMNTFFSELKSYHLTEGPVFNCSVIAQ